MNNPAIVTEFKTAQGYICKVPGAYYVDSGILLMFGIALVVLGFVLGKEI